MKFSPGSNIEKPGKKSSFSEGFFSEIDVLDFDREAAGEASDIMGRLLSLDTPVNGMDVLIAGKLWYTERRRLFPGIWILSALGKFPN